VRKVISPGFDAWWALWSVERGTAYESAAQHAWVSVMKPEMEREATGCTLSYLAGHEPTRGFAPHNFLFTQAREGFRARWPPLQGRPPSRRDELNRKGIERAVKEAKERATKQA
jgi:hypothetical protein